MPEEIKDIEEFLKKDDKESLIDDPSFKTDEEMGFTHAPIKKKKEPQIKDHFDAGSIKLSPFIAHNLENVVEYAMNKIVKEKYTIEVDRNQLDRSRHSDDYYECTIIRIKETGDECYIGEISFRYRGNGHKDINEPLTQFLSEVVKRPQDILVLDDFKIPGFADPILERILVRKYVGKCEASETDFLEDLVSCAEEAFENGVMGLAATDEEYVPGSDYKNEKSEILEFKKEDKRFTNIFEILKDRLDGNPEKAESKLMEFRGKAYAGQIITSLAEKKYDIALSFAKKMDSKDYILIESVCRELSSSYHSKTHSHSEIK